MNRSIHSGHPWGVLWGDWAGANTNGWTMDGFGPDQRLLPRATRAREGYAPGVGASSIMFANPSGTASGTTSVRVPGMVVRVVVLGLMLWAGSVAAEAGDARAPQPATLEATAARVARAVDERRPDEVERVAKDDDPDPWLVAEALLIAGRVDAARALASALPSPHGEGLRRRLEDARPCAPRVFAGLKDAMAAACLRDWDRVLVVATAADAHLGDDAASVALAFERARALGGLGRSADAARVAADAAASAEGLGWWRGAARSRHLAALQSLLLSPTRAQRAWDDLDRVGRAARDDGIRATAFEGLATTRERSQDVRGALLAAEEAVALRTRVGDAGPLARAESLRGALLLRAGRKRDARDALESARARAEAAGDTATSVSVLAGLGSLHLLEGEAALAVRFLSRAAELAQAADATEQAARVLVHLASARRALGDAAAALDDMRAAEALFVRVGDQHGRIRALLTVALLRSDVGDLAGALRAGEEALGLARAAGDPEGLRLACSRLACSLLAAGDEEAGEAILERYRTMPGVDADPVIDAARRMATVRTAADAQAVLADLGPLLAAARQRGDAASAARFVLQSAALRLVAGDLDGARDAYAEAVTEADRLHDGRLLAAALAGTASVFLAAGRPDAALAWARDAVARVDGLVRGLGDEEGAYARAVWGDVYEIGARAAAIVGDPVWEHWFLESGRGGALLEALGARAVAAALLPAPELRAAVEAASATESKLRATLDAGVVAGLPNAKLRSLSSEWDEAVRHVREAESARDRRTKQGLAFYPKPAPLPTVRAALAADEALVTYHVAGDQVGAIVVTNASVRRVALGSVEAMRRTVAFDPEASRVAADAALEAQRAAFVTPLALPATVRRLVVVPDDELAYLPFAALLPHVDVALSPSATVYLHHRTVAGGADARRGEGTLALGDPLYGVATVGGLRSAQMMALPGTAAEARAVGDVVLLGAEATVPALRKALGGRPRWRAVHLGCHGIVDTAHPSMSALYVSATSDHDGRLRVSDLLRETLSADLVVLSACETARGAVVRAEGVLGLARAVMHAGAPRVVASLWKVDDEATLRLMTEFHTRWKAGVPAGQALREAQAVVRGQAKWAHPTFWAAWTLWGLPQ